MAKVISIYSLGGLTLQYDGQVVTGLSSRKMEALMAYLAYTGRLHSREHLADLFWTDSPIEVGLANLRVMLSRLRKSFPEHLSTSRQTVGLVDGMAWSDAGEIMQCLSEALSQWRGSSRLLPAAVGRMEEAIALYKGAFMEGLALKEAEGFDNWVSQERERIRALLIEASFALAELYQKQNNPENAKRLLQNVIRIDAVEERAHRQLMQVYWEQGQRDLAIDTYEQLKTLLYDELGTSPNSETQALLKRIKSTEAGRFVAKNIALHLPHDSSVFVGRQRELAEITSRLRDEACRLLTIIGLGGVGKTRLSLAAARILATDADSFPDGIYFVALEDVPANLIIPSIGAAIGKGGYTLENFKQLSSFLSERKALLILDNFEHLVDEAETISKLLEAAPKIKIMLSSRERLQLREEWLYDVHGLDCPETDSVAVLEASEAVQMLHSATNQVGIRLALGRDGHEIASLCRLVDGMPLALEMAASLIRDFGLEQLLQRMETSMDVLRSNLRNIPQRQMSLRVLFDSVWERLTAGEKAVLLRLSVFSGYISKEAAIAIAGAKDKDLAALQSRLLLREAEIGRYSLHPLVRQYAFEKLANDTQSLIESQDKHAHYFSSFLSSRANQISSRDFRAACDAVELEIENIRSAWSYLAKTSGAARMVEMLHPLAKYHMLMERNEQGETLFSVATGQKLPRSLQGWILVYRANFKQNLRQFAPIPELLSEAEILLREAHDNEGLTFALFRKVFHRHSVEHLALEALEILKEAQALAQDLKHQEYIATGAYLEGAVLSALGKLSEANPCIQAAINAKLENPKLYADCLWLLGMNYFRREQMEQALETFEKTLEFDRDCQFEAHYAHTLIISGSCQMVLERYQEAEQSFLQSIAFYKEVKNFGAMSVCHERLGELCLRTGREEEGIKFYELYGDWAKGVGAWEGYIHTLSNMASTFQSLNQAHPKAREAYKEAIAIAEREGIIHSKANALRAGEWVELTFQDYPLAFALGREATAIYRELENYGGMRWALHGIFKLAMQTEQLELAAWLKAAFLLDPDTDDAVIASLTEAELPEFTFDKIPNLLEAEEMLRELKIN